MRETNNSNKDDAQITEYTQSLIIRSLTEYGSLGTDSRDDGPLTVIDHTVIELSETDTRADRFEVLVDAVGRVEFDDIYANQGNLLFVKENCEGSLIGFEDGKLLLEVKQFSGEQQ
jgi:hypothetical protein